MSLQRTEYFRSELLSIRHVSCRGAHKGLSDMESADGNTLILPVRGVFIEHFSREYEVLAEPNAALMIPAGSHSRVSHPISAEDDCLVVEFSKNFEAFPIQASHALLRPSVVAVRNILQYRLRKKFCDALEVEESAIALLLHSLHQSGGSRARRPLKSKTLRQIETARVILISHPEKTWSLSSLARHLECSAFHLTRMFRRHVGVTLHRYQMYVRLARSIELILDGSDLTNVALNLGFSSHSHFTAAFRQHIGFPPNRIREAVFSSTAEETRKNLIAALA